MEQPEKQEQLFIELGAFIKIIAPSNPDLNDNTYFILRFPCLSFINDGQTNHFPPQQFYENIRNTIFTPCPAGAYVISKYDFIFSIFNRLS